MWHSSSKVTKYYVWQWYLKFDLLRIVITALPLQSSTGWLHARTRRQDVGFFHAVLYYPNFQNGYLLTILFILLLKVVLNFLYCNQQWAGMFEQSPLSRKLWSEYSKKKRYPMHKHWSIYEANNSKRPKKKMHLWLLLRECKTKRAEKHLISSSS